MQTTGIRNIRAPGASFLNQAIRSQLVLAAYRACGNHGSVFKPTGTDKPPLAPQENGGLIQQDPSGNISQQGRRCLVLIGREVEMNVSAAHFTVILSAGSAGHQAITEIDQAAKRDKGKQDGLFQRNRMRTVCLFFQNGSFSYMGAITHHNIVQKNRIPEKTAFQLYPGPDIAVFNCNRPFITQFCTGKGERFIAIGGFPAKGSSCIPAAGFMAINRSFLPVQNWVMKGRLQLKTAISGPG